MVFINNAFRKKIIEDMFSKLKSSPATATLSLQIYNKDANINKDTKLADLDSLVKKFDITPSENNIVLARKVEANEDLTIAGLKYKITDTVPEDEYYWNVLIAEVDLAGTEEYNIVALVYTESDTEIPILIEKYAKTKTLTAETMTITIVVKF